MKKIIKYLLFCFLIYICNTTLVFALEEVQKGVVGTSSLNLRSGASSSSKQVATLTYGDIFTIIDYASSGNGCSKDWYKVKVNDKEGYLCSNYTDLLTSIEAPAILLEDKPLRVGPTTNSTMIVNMPSGSQITVMGLTNSNWYYVKYDKKIGFVYNYRVSLNNIEETDDKFKTEVLPKFPSSYHSYLIKLHNAHPNWIFEAQNTGVSFQDALKKESAVGVSLINSTYQGYYSTAGGAYDYTTDTFFVKEGKSWYAANEKTIAYFMDPRNYLNETNIFAFEKLSYDEQLHTLDTVKSTLAGFPNLLKYAEDFMTAAQEIKVSPVHLASRSVQEIGSSTTAISGETKFTCGDVTYEGGYYNFFNIGAYTSENPVLLGLCTAVNRGWDTPAKSIAGGASTIANGYVKAGQDTGYLQRFNVHDGKINTSHQYMTNVAAPMSESSITYSGYKKSELLEGSFVFKIPVFKEGTLPDTVSVLPSEGNPNNYLKTVSIDGVVLETFNLDVNSYEINLPINSTKVEITGLPVSSKSTLTGTGTIDLSKTKSATLTVKSQSGTTRIYTFNFVLNLKNIVKVEDIVNDMSVKNNGIYIYEINKYATTDLVNEIKKKNAAAVIEFKTSSGENKSSTTINTGDKLTIKVENDSKIYTLVVKGDASGDGKIDILDLLKVQKHILGSSVLTNEYLMSSDVNSDDKVDILDLLKIQKHILGVSTIN